MFGGGEGVGGFGAAGLGGAQVIQQGGLAIMEGAGRVMGGVEGDLGCGSRFGQLLDTPGGRGGAAGPVVMFAGQGFEATRPEVTVAEFVLVSGAGLGGGLAGRSGGGSRPRSTRVGIG